MPKVIQRFSGAVKVSTHMLRLLIQGSFYVALSQTSAVPSAM